MVKVLFGELVFREYFGVLNSVLKKLYILAFEIKVTFGAFFED